MVRLAFALALPAVGLAVDIGVMYSVRARLQAACDSAARAAIVGEGSSAEERAGEVVRASFPGARQAKVSVTLRESGALVRSAVAARMFFLPVLGAPRIYVTASGEARR